jgi:hypothetical protein
MAMICLKDDNQIFAWSAGPQDGVSELLFWAVVGSLLGVILIFLLLTCCCLLLRASNKKKDQRTHYLERELEARALELDRFYQVPYLQNMIYVI